MLKGNAKQSLGLDVLLKFNKVKMLLGDCPTKNDKLELLK